MMNLVFCIPQVEIVAIMSVFQHSGDCTFKCASSVTHYDSHENLSHFHYDIFCLFLIQYNKYNTIIQHISAPVPAVDNTRIQIYMLMLYIHNRQKRYIRTDIHTDKELDKVLHRYLPCTKRD